MHWVRGPTVLPVVTLVASIWCGSAACHAHVQLDAPTASASADARVAAYEELAPRGYAWEFVVRTGTSQIDDGAISARAPCVDDRASRPGSLRGFFDENRSQTAKELDFPCDRRATIHAADVVLGSGARIHHVTDLLPVVPPDSATARRIEAVEDARWLTLGLAMGASAVAVGGTGAIVALEPSDAVTRNAGIGVFLGSAALALGAMYLYAEANRLEVPVYESYDADLMRHLDLCRNDEGVFACADAEERPGAEAPVSAR